MANQNIAERRRLVRSIVEQHYEPGRQDRCKLWVFRNIVARTYPMSERTFFRCLSAGDAPRYVQQTLF